MVSDKLGAIHFTAPDDFTFVVSLPAPADPNIIIQTLGIVGPGSVINSKLALENEQNGDMAADWLRTHSAGSGKFTFDGWRPNERIVLNRNENYWGSDPSEMTRIIMRHIPESQNQRLLLEKGDLDIGYNLAATDLRGLEDRDDVTVLSQRGVGFFYVGVSMQNDFFSNQKVREALRYLIDYEGINSAVMPYYGVAHQRPIQTGYLGVLPDQGYTLDLDKAKALLAEAGYPDGFKTTIRALSEPPFITIATALQSTLKQAGIDAEVISGSGEVVYGAMRDRKFDIIVGQGGGGIVPHPDSNLRASVYNPDNSGEAKLTNFQGWRTSFFDEQLNKMIVEALNESDHDKQVVIYGDIQRRLDDLVPSIQPFSEVLDSVAYRSDLQGYILNPSWPTDLGAVTKVR